MALELSPDLFEPVTVSEDAAEAIERPSISFWRDVVRRFFQSRLATTGLAILVLMILAAFFGPYISGHSGVAQNWELINTPPSKDYWFGGDQLGRDLFTRTWLGARISLLIGVVAAAIDIFIGVLYGLFSGYRGGFVDDIMMRIVDVLYGFPYLLMVILLLVVLQPGLWTLIIALGLIGWIGASRLVRGQTLQMKEQEYVLAARTLGARTGRIMGKHLLPNVMGIVIINLTLSIPGAIFGEAFLAFIGLGVPPPSASLGTLIQTGYTVYNLYPWEWLFPGAVLALILFAFNSVGDGLRDALDPKLRQ